MKKREDQIKALALQLFQYNTLPATSLATLMALLLSACGGGSGDASEASSSSAAGDASEVSSHDPITETSELDVAQIDFVSDTGQGLDLDAGGTATIKVTFNQEVSADNFFSLKVTDSRGDTINDLGYAYLDNPGQATTTATFTMPAGDVQKLMLGETYTLIVEASHWGEFPPQTYEFNQGFHVNDTNTLSSDAVFPAITSFSNNFLGDNDSFLIDAEIENGIEINITMAETPSMPVTYVSGVEKQEFFAQIKEIGSNQNQQGSFFEMYQTLEDLNTLSVKLSSNGLSPLKNDVEYGISLWLYNHSTSEWTQSESQATFTKAEPPPLALTDIQFIESTGQGLYLDAGGSATIKANFNQGISADNNFSLKITDSSGATINNNSWVYVDYSTQTTTTATFTMPAVDVKKLTLGETYTHSLEVYGDEGVVFSANQSFKFNQGFHVNDTNTLSSDAVFPAITSFSADFLIGEDDTTLTQIERDKGAVVTMVMESAPAMPVFHQAGQSKQEFFVQIEKKDGADDVDKGYFFEAYVQSDNNKTLVVNIAKTELEKLSNNTEYQLSAWSYENEAGSWIKSAVQETFTTDFE